MMVGKLKRYLLFFMGNEREYTVAEIAALRAACRAHFFWGSTCREIGVGGLRVSEEHNVSDVDKGVDKMMRGYMHAGITAEQIIEKDRAIIETKIALRKAAQKASQNAG